MRGNLSVDSNDTLCMNGCIRGKGDIVKRGVKVHRLKRMK